MFRHEDGKDITNEEYNNYLLPHVLVSDRYLRDVIAPQYCAFYIASGFRMGSLWEDSLRIHVQSVLDIFNYDFKNVSRIMKLAKELLLSQYGLSIVSDNPLVFKDEWSVRKCLELILMKYLTMTL